MSPLNIAVVGTGIFATDAHLPAIKNIPELNVTAAFNRTKSKAEVFAKKAKISKVYDNLEDVFEDKSIDFVDALLPVQYNLDVVKLAIKHKKPIAFEKPIAANLTQAKEIVKLSESTDVPILVLENFTYLKALNIIKELLPKIGEVLSFTYRYTGPFNASNKYIATPWRLNPEHVGGYLSDGGVHQLAVLTEILGQVESVSALTKQVREQSGADDILFSTFKLKSGVIGTFTYGSAFGATDKTSVLTIYGTEGSIDYDFSPSLANPTVTYQTGTSNADISAKTVIQIEENATIEEEFKNIAASVVAKDKSVLNVPPRKAFHHFAIVVAALESSKNNGSSVKVETP
ncbi:uncharacterized protein RJT21DRAFT_82407 [Scheffersomyces amazonensis]|uniref:uncharacterized protein n=1 Tax=Scheffersomyces amazonensis TaxID=1078765 RepID=UPI00315D3C26